MTIHHLDDATWERLAMDEVDAELDAEERRQAFDHITRCSSCRDIYRGLRLLKKESRSLRRGRFFSFSPWWTLAAATAVLVLAVVLFIPRQTDETITRSDSQIERVDAEYYRARLFAADGTLLWESDRMPKPSPEWPQSVPRTKGVYYWQFQAFRGTNLLQESDLSRVEIP